MKLFVTICIYLFNFCAFGQDDRLSFAPPDVSLKECYKEICIDSGAPPFFKKAEDEISTLAANLRDSNTDVSLRKFESFKIKVLDHYKQNLDHLVKSAKSEGAYIELLINTALYSNITIEDLEVGPQLDLSKIEILPKEVKQKVLELYPPKSKLLELAITLRHSIESSSLDEAIFGLLELAREYLKKIDPLNADTILSTEVSLKKLKVKTLQTLQKELQSILDDVDVDNLSETFLVNTDRARDGDVANFSTYEIRALLADYSRLKLLEQLKVTSNSKVLSEGQNLFLDFINDKSATLLNEERFKGLNSKALSSQCFLNYKKLYLMLPTIEDIERVDKAFINLKLKSLNTFEVAFKGKKEDLDNHLEKVEIEHLPTKEGLHKIFEEILSLKNTGLTRSDVFFNPLWFLGHKIEKACQKLSDLKVSYSDHFDPVENKIHYSWNVTKNDKSLSATLAHEIGHAVSSYFTKGNELLFALDTKESIDSPISKKYKDIKICLNEKHPEYEEYYKDIGLWLRGGPLPENSPTRNLLPSYLRFVKEEGLSNFNLIKTEEDFADWWSAQIIKKSDAIAECTFVDPNDPVFYNSSWDVHSSPMFRLLNVLLHTGNSIPKVCLDELTTAKINYSRSTCR